MSRVGGQRTVTDVLDEESSVIHVGAGERLTYLIPVIRDVVGERKREVVLEGEGAEVEVRGIFLGSGEAKLALTLDIIHAAAHTRSNTLFKGALTGKSVFDLNGVIRITKDGHGADAYLEERALLLSPDALATTIPSLEIEANDVKCKHAATAEAEAMIAQGFLGSALGLLPESWQNKVQGALLDALSHHA